MQNNKQDKRLDDTSLLNFNSLDEESLATTNNRFKSMRKLVVEYNGELYKKEVRAD